MCWKMCIRDSSKVKVNDDEQIGLNILTRALEEPARLIAENAGKEGSVIVSQMGKGRGYDARKEEFVDMIQAGILDPVKVTRLALENAASVASLLLTTEAVVVEKPKKDEPAMPNPGAGMDMM